MERRSGVRNCRWGCSVGEFSSVAAGSLLVVVACASTPPVATDAVSQYEIASRLIAEGEPKAAAVEYQKLLYNYPESVWADEAQMGLAEAYYQSEQYILAEAAYRRLIELHPSGQLAPKAQAMIGLSLLQRARKAELDQEMTWRAKSHLERFLQSHPDHPSSQEAREGLAECLDRLAEKDFKNGRFYLKIGRMDAARRYFERVLRDYPDTRWAAEALFGRAESWRHEGDTDAAVADYHLLIENYAASDAAGKAQDVLERLGTEVQGGS
jgi:outer membrane protein assembly factor BamD